MDRLLAHYKKLDDVLGEVIDYTDDHDADLYVVSDHGFGPIEDLVYANRILEREGYLFRREDDGTRGALASLGISRDAITGALNRVGITEKALVQSLPDSWSTPLPSRFPAITPSTMSTSTARSRSFTTPATCTSTTPSASTAASSVPARSRRSRPISGPPWSRQPTPTGRCCSRCSTGTICSRRTRSHRTSS